jgi:hypothetical protein
MSSASFSSIWRDGRPPWLFLPSSDSISASFCCSAASFHHELFTTLAAHLHLKRKLAVGNLLKLLHQVARHSHRVALLLADNHGQEMDYVV